MAQKLNYIASESFGFVEEQALDIRNFLLDGKITALRLGVILPDEFIENLEDFALRNSIKITENNDSYCLRCIKAHAIKKARSQGLGSKAIDFLENFFKCEKGHSGYYMDGEDIIKF